jgi:hypothetical protein
MTKAPTASETTRRAQPAEEPRVAKALKKPLRKPEAAATDVTESPAAPPQPVVSARPRSTRPEFRMAAGPSGEVVIRLSKEISAEMTSFAEDAIAAGSDGLQNAATAKTLPELIKRQSRSARIAANLWVQHSSRIGAICMAAFGNNGSTR